MLVYDGQTAIGEILDYGRGKVLAVNFTATGKRVSLGFRPTRRDAMRAISARHAGGPEPPKAVNAGGPAHVPSAAGMARPAPGSV
jgi:hypothetical protein